MKKTISVLLSLLLIFSSFGIIGVFAEDQPDADVAAAVEAYNAAKADYSGLFSFPATQEQINSLIAQLNSKVAQLFKEIDLQKTIYSDEVATALAKITSELLNTNLSSLGFGALSAQYPDAYAYVQAAKAEGKTWDNLGTIPFGIKAGDKDAFVKAIAAGCENFGDTLLTAIGLDWFFALFESIETGMYDAFVELIESLHVETLPDIDEYFYGGALPETGGGVVLMGMITEILTQVVEKFMADPVNYLLEILPDFIVAYNNLQAVLASDAVVDKLQLSISLPSLDTLIGDLLANYKIELPETDLEAVTLMAVASAAESSVAIGWRVRLDGDKPVIFVTLYNYLVKVLNYGENKTAIKNLITGQTGDASDGDSVTEAPDIIEQVKSICNTIDKVISVMDSSIPGVVGVLAKFVIFQKIAEFFRMIIEKFRALFN